MCRLQVVARLHSSAVVVGKVSSLWNKQWRGGGGRGGGRPQPRHVATWGRAGLVDMCDCLLLSALFWLAVEVRWHDGESITREGGLGACVVFSGTQERVVMEHALGGRGHGAQGAWGWRVSAGGRNRQMRCAVCE